MGIASLVLGIVAVVFCWIPCVNFLCWILAPVGLALGIVAIVKANKTGKGKGLAIAGTICSGIALAISTLMYL